MLELAAIDMAMHALAKRPPAIVRPVMEAGESVKAFERRLHATLDEAERDTEAWCLEGVRASQQMVSAIEEAREHMDPAALSSRLSKYIDAVEQVLGDQTRQQRKLDAAFKGVMKKAKSISPQYEAAVARIVERVLAIAEKESEEKSQFALLLRALKASLEPKDAEALVFSDPKELDAFLRHAAAA